MPPFSLTFVLENRITKYYILDYNIIIKTILCMSMLWIIFILYKFTHNFVSVLFLI